MGKLNSETSKAYAYTAFYVVFLLTVAFSALSLRGNIPLTDTANMWLGNIQAAIFLAALITIVFKATRKG